MTTIQLLLIKMQPAVTRHEWWAFDFMVISNSFHLFLLEPKKDHSRFSRWIIPSSIPKIVFSFFSVPLIPLRYFSAWVNGLCVYLMSVALLLYKCPTLTLTLTVDFCVIFLNRRHCVRICSFSKVNINLIMTLRRQQQSTCSFCVYNKKKPEKNMHTQTDTRAHTIGFHLHGI